MAYAIQSIYQRKIREGLNALEDRDSELNDGRDQTKVWKFLNTLDGTYKEKLKHLLNIL